MRWLVRLLVVGVAFGRRSQNSVFGGCRVCPVGGQGRLQSFVSMICLEGRLVEGYETHLAYGWERD
jgi:hypothetical protein